MKEGDYIGMHNKLIMSADSIPRPHEIYLNYAHDLQSTSPIVAVYCKMYYVTREIAQRKESHSSFAPAESNNIHQLLQTIEQEQKAIGLKPEEKRKRVEEYCTSMCSALSQLAVSSQVLADQYKTAANFINLLTIFGPLSPPWAAKRKTPR